MAATDATPEGARRILVVDDEEGMRAMLTMLLSRNPPSKSGKANNIIGNTLTGVISRDQNRAA